MNQELFSMSGIPKELVMGRINQMIHIRYVLIPYQPELE